MSDFEILSLTWSNRGAEVRILTPWGEERTLTVLQSKINSIKSKPELLTCIQASVTKWKARKNARDSVDSMSLIGEKITENTITPK